MFIFESPSTSEFRQRFDEKLQKMFSSISIKEGTIWIEAFYDGKDYYFNEAGYRYGGSVSIYPIDYLYGINQMAADIHYALTGESKISGYTSLIDAAKERRHVIVFTDFISSPGR